MTADAIACPSCGAKATGNFCNKCGAPLTARKCEGCGSPLAAGSRFCHRCGRGAGVGAGSAAGGGMDKKVPLVVAIAGALALAGVLVAVAWKASPSPAAQPAAVESGGMPDLSTMTPRERFGRLFDRVMRAATAGDQSTVETFTPMAIMAYTQLDSIDADARYDVALLHMHTGGMAQARALADTILKETPSHLFGHMIRGTLARFQQDAAGERAAAQAFLRHYEAEMALQRPEYAEHRPAVDEFLRQARALEAR